MSDKMDWWLEGMGLDKQPLVQVRAWLVTWEGVDERSFDGHHVHPSVRERGQVVAVLNPDLPIEAIAFFVERMYAMLTLSAAEQVEEVWHGPHSPATKGDNRDVRVGREPYLRARLVEDLLPVGDKDWVAGDNSQLNELSWTDVLPDGSRKPMRGRQL